MRLARIQIENFRNFHKLDVKVGTSIVILGENRIGKTNLIHALRLVLDPSLPDTARQLRRDDFWDGIPRPLSSNSRIRISVDLAEFEADAGQLAILAEHLIQPDPMVARLTYEFGPVQGLNHAPTKDDDFEFVTYGGDRRDNQVGYEVRKRIPLEILHALRDAEGDLARWTRSPLKPLIDRAGASIDRSELDTLAIEVSSATEKVAGLESIGDLATRINDKLKGMAGSSQAIETALGFSPTDPDKLLRTLRLLFDGRRRDISEASLGTANVLYLALRTLDLESMVGEGAREHTFFGIEEPEAHLHPHLQRLVYRNYLRPRQPSNTDDKDEARRATYMFTTHSPHIASVTPIESLILLQKDIHENATVGVSGAAIALTDEERDDIERYLDVSRAEGLFGRGILLVEGDAEKFLVPVLAARAGHDLDSLGITVCSVGGTNFAPYVKFFGPQGLKIPLAVLTDLDPISTTDEITHDLGRSRAHALCPLIQPNTILPKDIRDVKFYETFGVFLNGSTLETELNESGCILLMNSVMQALCEVEVAKERFQKLADSVNDANKAAKLQDPKRFVKDIEYVGKGRFAQRLCAEIRNHHASDDVCPPYIVKAIAHVIR